MPAVTPPVLWRPAPDARATTRIGAYMDWMARERGRSFTTYDELLAWSTTELGPFWQSVWDHFDVHSVTDPGPPLADARMPGARWFPDAQLNWAEHALRLTQRGGDDIAVIAHSQSRPRTQLSVQELRDAVASTRNGLLRLGVRKGDRVAAYLPNVPEAAVALLACASIGAIWSSCAPEFGTRSVVDRFSQVAPTVLLTIDGYRYGERRVDRTDEVAAIRAALPSLAATVVLPYLEPDASRIPGAIAWDDAFGAPGDLAFEALPFDHPLYILYSSGTTGLPKPIVHGHGGILLEHLKIHALHHDLGPASRFFWYSTTGWMMWNYLVSGLLVDATIVLYDGAPNAPDLGALWRLAADEGVTLFGTSAPYLMACRKEGLRPGEEADLSALRAIGSTGAPLPVEGFRYVHDAIGARDPGAVRVRRDRRVHRLRGRLPARARLGGRDQLPPPGLRGRGVQPRRPPAGRGAGRAGAHRPDALHAGRVLGRRGRVALPGSVFRRLPDCLAPRGLDHVHRARLVRD